MLARTWLWSCFPGSLPSHPDTVETREMQYGCLALACWGLFFVVLHPWVPMGVTKGSSRRHSSMYVWKQIVNPSAKCLLGWNRRRHTLGHCSWVLNPPAATCVVTTPPVGPVQTQTTAVWMLGNAQAAATTTGLESQAGPHQSSRARWDPLEPHAPSSYCIQRRLQNVPGSHESFIYSASLLPKPTCPRNI